LKELLRCFSQWEVLQKVNLHQQPTKPPCKRPHAAPCQRFSPSNLSVKRSRGENCPQAGRPLSQKEKKKKVSHSAKSREVTTQLAVRQTVRVATWMAPYPDGDALQSVEHG
jgi:hypothetical protein